MKRERKGGGKEGQETEIRATECGEEVRKPGRGVERRGETEEKWKASNKVFTVLASTCTDNNATRKIDG